MAGREIIKQLIEGINQNINSYLDDLETYLEEEGIDKDKREIDLANIKHQMEISFQESYEKFTQILMQDVFSDTDLGLPSVNENADASLVEEYFHYQNLLKNEGRENARIKQEIEHAQSVLTEFEELYARSQQFNP